MGDELQPVWAIDTEEIALGYMLIFLVLAFPLIPALDLASFVVGSGYVGKNPPPIAQILVYGLSIAGYIAFFFFVELRLLEKVFGKKIFDLKRVVIYLQVIPLSFIFAHFESSTFNPHFSKLVANFIVKAIRWLFGFN